MARGVRPRLDPEPIHHASRGAVLLAALLIVSMVMVLGALSVNLATNELRTVTAAKDDAATRYLAESAVAAVMQWFHDPQAVPEAIPADLFHQRHDDPGRGPSFFDGLGRSQFQGTADRPDVLLLASNPEHDRLLHDPDAGLLRGLGNLGRLLALRFYGPAQPGQLGTVEVTVGPSGVPRTTSVQLGVRRIPRLRAAVQLGGARGPDPATMQALWVHWGDVLVGGDAAFGPLRELPAKTPLAAVTGLSYEAAHRPEDRWVDYFVGGEVRMVRTPDARTDMPGHIHARQDPVPGLRFDPWDYHELKDAALRFGSYYVLRHDGYLYPDGANRWERRRTADDVFASEAVGDHRGLVFIDTPERRAPQFGALRTVTVTVPYAEGLFVVNAHVVWRPRGPGQSVPALSPPAEGTSSLRGRIPVTLSRIHLQGVLVTPGRITVSGRPRLYGAVSAGETVTAPRLPPDRLEVWHDHALTQGLARGMPLVYVVPGSRRDRW